MVYLCRTQRTNLINRSLKGNYIDPLDFFYGGGGVRLRNEGDPPTI